MTETTVMRKSHISNHWGSADTVKVPAEEFVVYHGAEGSLYNHHHQLTSMDGHLIVTWSSADVHEDSPGQRMMVATSDDMGTTWSKARPLIDRQPGKFGEGVVTATGLHIYDGRMVAYWGYYDYTEGGLERLYGQTTGINGRIDTGVVWHTDIYTGISVSDDGGRSWSLAGMIEGTIGYIAPHRLRSGRLILPCNNWFPWTDDPYGIDGWKVAKLPGCPYGVWDDPQGFWMARDARGDEYACCEGSCFQTEDGVVHMMLRTDAGFLAVSESHDQGKTYSEHALTDYTDSSSRFHFGRLSDGRYFATSCPTPKGDAFRTPLILATSDDGINFNKHYIIGDEPNQPPRAEGLQKFGRYGYPSHHIVDKTLFVIYSICKEDIAISRVPLKAISV